MQSSHLRPVQIFSHCSKLLALKLTNVQTSMPASTLIRLESRPLSYSKACVHLQYSHLWKSKQNKSVLPLATVNNSLVISSRHTVSESGIKNPSPRPRKDLMTNPFRNEKFQNQSLLREIIAGKGDTAWTDEDWTHLAESLPLASRGLWEVTCMHMLYVDKNISFARKLMGYLESQTSRPNLIALTFYIGLLGETSSGCEDQADETFKYYQRLLSYTADVLDAASIEVLISGLAMTKHYHECFKLLKICKETSTPSPGSLVKLLRAGLRYKDTDVCKFALAEFESNAEITGFNAFIPQLVDECLASDNQPGLHLVMDFVQKHRLLIQTEALDEIVDTFNRYQPNQWTGNYGYIQHRKGLCSICGHQMKKSDVSDEDFKAVQSAFLKQVIVGRNVFFKTSPDEVQSFVAFVQKMGPFDVVIDGMNVMYCGVRKANQLQLEKAVQHFSTQGKKILILGSRMLNGHIHNIKKMVPRPSVYMTTTTRADDAFFLYAALHSGKNTLVVSSDKFRDHKFLLDPSLRHIFKQWVSAAQVYDWYISKSEFQIGKRHLYMIGPAHDDGGWHLPVMDVDSANPFGRLSVLCLQDRTHQMAPHTAVTQTKATDSISRGHVRKQDNKTVLTSSNVDTSTHKEKGHTHVTLATPNRKLQKLKKTKLGSEQDWFDS